MSEPAPATEGACPLCATAIGGAVPRCPECGWSLAGVDGRPGPYSKLTLWWTGCGLLAVYLITLAIVALTH